MADLARHAQHPIAPDYSLCGFAFDAGSSDDRDEGDLLFAGDGETVTCRDCRAIVLAIRAMKIGRVAAPEVPRG